MIIEARLVEYKKVSCVLGYHIYKDITKATVGEAALVCILKPGSTHNQYVAAMEKNRTVKGCLPQKVSHVYTLFLKKSGCIQCRVTGRQR